jgi:hypothetical protein
MASSVKKGFFKQLEILDNKCQLLIHIQNFDAYEPMPNNGQDRIVQEVFICPELQIESFHSDLKNIIEKYFQVTEFVQKEPVKKPTQEKSTQVYAVQKEVPQPQVPIHQDSHKKSSHSAV